MEPNSLSWFREKPEVASASYLMDWGYKPNYPPNRSASISRQLQGKLSPQMVRAYQQAEQKLPFQMFEMDASLGVK